MHPEQEMLALEEALLHTRHTDNQNALEAMLAGDFWEVSANGRRSSRAQVLQWLLHKDPEARWQLQNIKVKELGDACRLVQYHARQIAPVPSSGQGAWHSSVWCRENPHSPWRLAFHQATRLS